MDYYKISPKIKDLLIYKSPPIKTPFHNDIKIVFADVIASGRPSPLVEQYISEKILPYYSNTHSNAYCGIMMKNLVNETKNYIRECLHIDKSKKIIFTGSGTTCAINHLIYCLKLDNLPKVNIFVSAYEHHSNYLPWIEMSKRSKNINFYVIPPTNNFDINMDFIENIIKKDNEIVNIISITACSNVLGIRMNIKDIYDKLQKYNTCECCYGKRNLLFIDYACNAPYDEMDGRYADAIFFSPHKFLGGVATPGVLLANKELFHNQSPFIPGGGCVKKVCKQYIEYEKDVEKRETAGTPNIIGIIKIKKILELKSIFKNVIQKNEHAITKYIFNKFQELQNKYKNLIVLLPDLNLDYRLPIVCIAIKEVHYNFLVTLLSDLFGIQTRGGVSCTGILADLIKNKYDIVGWCRISFNWLMDQEEIDYILNSVEFVIQNHNQYKDYYEYNEKENLYIHNNKT